MTDLLYYKQINICNYLVVGNQLSMRPADGLVTGQKNVTIFTSHHILFTRVEIVGLTCEKQVI